MPNNLEVRNNTKVSTGNAFSEVLMNSLITKEEALPKDFNKARFVQNALALLNNNADLAKYKNTQIISGLMQGAILGLDAYNKECYLVPYGSKLNYQTSYKGAQKLVKKYSIRPVKDIYAKLVREGDLFEEEIKDGEPNFTFKPKAFNDGAIIGAFAVVLFADGGMQYEVMSLKELENTRKQSKAQNSPAWKNFTGEMYRKTVIHRLCKHIEIDFENPTQQSAFLAGMEIETDPVKLRDNDISEVETDEEFIIDGEMSESDIPDFMTDGGM